VSIPPVPGSERADGRSAAVRSPVMDMGTVGLLLAGFVTLVAGGELLVRGASGITAAVGMSPLVVGLTVVAFATSAPELAVTLQAVRDGSPDLAVGNVVGSNIANVLLVLGIAALIGPVVVRSQLVRVDVPVLVAMGVLLLLVSLDGLINRGNGALLFACLVGYVISAVLMGRRETRPADPDAPPDPPPDSPPDSHTDPSPAAVPRRNLLNAALLVVGVALLVLGADWLVEGATRIANERGVPEMVIGLTVVAVGTSLPELATTVIAALRGQRDLAVGNAVGSSIFNIGAVLGFGALLAPDGIPVAESAIRIDIPIMIAVSVALLPVIFTGFEIRRWEGALFVGLYVAYTVYLLMNATDHERLPAYSAVMLWFVLPTIAIALVALAVFDTGRQKGRAESHATADRGPSG
jgi:cation:H+ antiporter